MGVQIALQRYGRFDLSWRYSSSQSYFNSYRYKLFMADPEAQYILNSRPARQREQPFFACMQCYPDESESESRSLSSTYSRRHLHKKSMQQPHVSGDRTNQNIYLKVSELMESRKSTNLKGEKISIKNRRSSNFQRQSIILPERENIPSHLANTHQPSLYRQPETARSSISSVRCSNLDRTVTNSINSGINSNTGLRKSVPTVAFTYQKATQNKLPVPAMPSSGFLSPAKSNQSNLSSNISSNRMGYSPKEITPYLNKLNPKVAISKNIEQQYIPLRQSDYLHRIPEEPSYPLKLQFSNKGISDLFNEKDREVYDSLESIPHLSKHSSSNGSEPPIQRKKSSLGHNFGHGRGRLKVRQTVSIKEPEEEDLHQSIVIEKSNRGNLVGLLNPINESDEFGSAMGATILCHGRGGQPGQMIDEQF